MKKIFCTLIAIGGINCSFSFSQIIFQKHYGGNGGESGGLAQQTSDGGYIMTGTTNSFGAGGTDVYLVKSDSQGNVQWSKTIGGNGNEASASMPVVQQTTDGGYVILATSLNSFTTNASNEMYIAKLDASGNLQWNKLYTNTIDPVQADDGQYIIQTSDGGYALTGMIWNYAGGNYEVALVKFNNAGNMQWTTSYGGANREYGYCIQQTSDGGFIMAGHTQISGSNWDIYLVKVNSAGTLQWTKLFGGASATEITSRVRQTSDSGYAILGYTTSFGSGGADVLLLKTNSTGNLQWSKTYGGSANDYGNGLWVTADGGFALGGSTSSFGNGGDGYLIKTDGNGNLQWSKIYGNTGGEGFVSAQQTTDQGYMLFGSTGSYGNGDFYLVKTDSLGNPACGSPNTLTTSQSFSTSSIGIQGGGSSIITPSATLTTPSTSSGNGTCPCSLSSSAVSTNNVSCFGGNNGSATATPSGGNFPYTYIWSNGQTVQTATGLSVGNYTVTITDGNGCSSASAVSISQPSSAVSASANSTPTSCSGSTGSATVNPSGGNSPYTYIWSNGQTFQTATGLSAGTYTVLVTDGNGCSTNATVNITSTNGLSGNLSAQTNVTCSGASNGSATATPSGGTSPFTYQWSNGATTSATTGLSAGAYTVIITDANGCTVSLTANISQPNAITANINATDISCNGGNTGSAAAAVAGGSPSYTYLWSNGQTTSAISNLGTGTYSVIVTDANGCTQTATAQVNDNSIVAVMAGCGNVCSGENIVLSATGGGTYLWNNGATTSSITAIATATATYSVTVSNGICSDTANCTVNILPAPLADFDTSSSGEYNSIYNFLDSSTGGVISWSWNFGDGGTSSLQNPIHHYPGAGTYTVTLIVTNANGCPDTIVKVVTVNEGILIPNVFTPNGDGSNDVWYIPSSGFDEYHIEIFNRWGNKLFDATSEEIRWDGRNSSGVLCSDGTYYYVLQGIFKTKEGGKDMNVTGYITLLSHK